ncbi:MAG: PTS sugar transporter subunit IIA [Deltaproteobacteria bacterium]|nr:PTS sugar transporter subunit IIA [Deltaproteobacteria bacterium]
MKITDILDDKLVLADLNSKTKKNVLEELVSHLAQYADKVDKEELLKVLLEREKLGSTGINDGIAVPHGKLKNIDKLLAVFGRSREGVDFGALDNKPSHLFFLLVAPESSAGTHLKALARISRIAQNEIFRERCMKTKTKEDLFKLIVEEDEKY